MSKQKNIPPIRAILRTRCGCERPIALSRPVLYVHIPLMRRPPTPAEAEMGLTGSVVERIFRLWRRDEAGTRIYAEEPPK